MKYVFVINPVAGNGEKQKELVRTITSACGNQDVPWEIYETKGMGDAMFFVRDYPGDNLVRFYAIGGDGTFNEVVNGAISRQHSEVGIFPCGSGNDFVRLFGSAHDFFDVEKQLHGSIRHIDVIKADGNYAINMCNMGIDAQTAADVHKFTSMMPGSMAYTASLFNRMIRPMGVHIKVILDKKEMIEGKFLLATFANGIAYGGGYYSAPKAQCDDGLMEVCLIKPVSRLKIANLLKIYKRGELLDHPKLQDLFLYRRAKSVRLETSKAELLCVDGEICTITKCEMTMCNQILPFILPQL